MMLRLCIFTWMFLPFTVFAAEGSHYGMPPEWFACKVSADCGLILRPCGFGLAVNLVHKAEAEEFVDKNLLYPLACSNVPRPPDGAACEKGQCIESWRTR